MSQFQGIYICDQSGVCGDRFEPHNSSSVYEPSTERASRASRNHCIWS